jgi:hypothetical protein
VSGLAGAVVWAVVPAVPEAPFRLYAGADHDPIELPRPGKLIAAARRGQNEEFTFLVPGKAAPVLIVSDRSDSRLEELLAVRLLALADLNPADREIVRAGGEHGLFYLDPGSFDLRGEHAAIVAALVRVHRSAINPKLAGRLGQHRLRQLHERIARHYGLDVRHLVRAELDRLAAERQRPGAGFSGFAPLHEDDDIVAVGRAASGD